MAIQLRRGAYENYDASKLKPAEVGVVQSGDPNTTDGKAVYIAINTNDVKRIPTADEMVDHNAEAEGIYDNIVAQNQTASQLFQNTSIKATEAEQSASTASSASASANSSMQRAETAANLLTNVTATAQTLEAGQQATASYRNGVFSFGIPKGDTGNISAIKSMIAGVESSAVATKNYSIGDLVIVGDTLYEVTAAIASGETISVSKARVTTVDDTIKNRIVAIDNVIENRIADSIDATLTQSGQAADSKAVGESFDDVREIVVGDNLCDNDKLTTGYLNSNGSIDRSKTYYQTSDYIPVVVGQTYNIVAYTNLYGAIVKTRYTALLYDTNKNVISGSYVNVDNTNGISVTVSDENAKYLRACSHIDPSIHLFQVEAGSEPTYMKKYSRSVLNNMDLPQIEPLKELEGIAHKKTGVNLLKQDGKEDGYIYNSTGRVIEVGNYYTSDYIKVEGGKSYVFYNFSSNARMVGALYDSNKDCIPSTYVNNASTKSLTFTAQQNGYIRVSTTKAIFMSYAMLVEGDTAPQTYEPYNEFYRLSDNVVVPDASNILKEKKWCPCGDSFTASTNAKYDSGLYSGANKVYPRIIALRNDMNLVSTFFASGRTLAYPSSGDFTNSLTCPSAPCYYQNIPADTDYITIMLGINDSHHENGVGGDGEDPTGVIPLGTIDDADTSTYYGAWNVVLSWLMENRPNAHIGIIVSNGCDRVAYRTAQIEIATKYGVPYIDLNGDSRTPAMIRTQNPNIATAVKVILRNKQAIDPDGSQTGSVNTHPNWQAHEYESTFIEDFLRSI